MFLDKFWESMGEELAGEWMQHVFSPAFLFWASGLGMYALRYGWQGPWAWITSRDLIEQIALLILALIILILSSLAMQQLRFSLLRLLEGYWPGPFGRLSDRLAEWQDGRLQRWEREWNELKGREGSLVRREARRLAELEMRTHYFPSDPRDLLPTAVGNTLKSAETIPAHKYGLDAFVCWPRLWMLLPDNARADLGAARQGLMTRVEFWGWGALSLLWLIWSPWALLVSALWLWLAWVLLVQSAMSYADLLESAFDLYRGALYQSVRWPVPQNTAAEKTLGRQLTEYIWRGIVEPPVDYPQTERKPQ